MYTTPSTLPAAFVRRARTSWDMTTPAVATASVNCGHRGTGLPAAGVGLVVRPTVPTVTTTTVQQIPTQIPTFGKGLVVAARDGNPGLRTRRRPPA